MPVSLETNEGVAVDVACSDDELTVVLDDGRSVSVPLEWFPRLAAATPRQRKAWEPIGGGIEIHWDAIDEDSLSQASSNRSDSCDWRRVPWSRRPVGLRVRHRLASPLARAVTLSD